MCGSLKNFLKPLFQMEMYIIEDCLQCFRRNCVYYYFKTYTKLKMNCKDQQINPRSNIIWPYEQYVFKGFFSGSFFPVGNQVTDIKQTELRYENTLVLNETAIKWKCRQNKVKWWRMTVFQKCLVTFKSILQFWPHSSMWFHSRCFAFWQLVKMAALTSLLGFGQCVQHAHWVERTAIFLPCGVLC